MLDDKIKQANNLQNRISDLERKSEKDEEEIRFLRGEIEK